MRLPESWREIRLTSLLTALETGGRPSGGVGEIESGIPSISGEHFDWNGTFDFSSLKFIPHDYFEGLQTGRLKQGDVLIVKDGATTAKCAFVDNDFPYEEAAVNEHIFLLRTDDALLDSRFLYEVLRSEYGRAQILKSYRGAAIGGIPRSFADHIKLPLPTLREQQRIVEMLRQAEEVGMQRERAQSILGKLAKQRFMEMFGHPAENPNGYESPPFQAFGALERGISKHRPRDASHLYGGPYPFIQTGDVSNAGDWITGYTSTYSEAGLAQSRLWPRGTLCITIAANIAKAAILDFDACFPDSVVGFTPHEDVQSEYVLYCLRFYQEYFEHRAPKSAQMNINLDTLRTLRMPKPPEALQIEFARFVQAIRLLNNQASIQADRHSDLLRELRAAAFCGELTAGWRDQHRAEIAAAALTRDTLLRERGAKLAARPPEPALPPPQEEVEPSHRHWLLSELSDFQRAVLACFLAYAEHPLFTEDAPRFEAFCDDEQVANRLADFDYSPNRIDRTLSQLADLGLIKQVSLPRTNPLTLEREYLKAFRPLRPGDQTRGRDVAMLAREIQRWSNPTDEEPVA